MKNLSDPSYIASLPTTRDEARSLGLPHYAGRACKFGHVVRKTSNKHCAECHREEERNRQPLRNEREREITAQLNAIFERSPDKCRTELADWLMNGHMHMAKMAEAWVADWNSHGY